MPCPKINSDHINFVSRCKQEAVPVTFRTKHPFSDQFELKHLGSHLSLSFTLSPTFFPFLIFVSLEVVFFVRGKSIRITAQ